MIGLLEKYASNLEGLVAQRTRELADEKERADQLLYQMLPRLYLILISNDDENGYNSINCTTFFDSNHAYLNINDANIFGILRI